jgi:hypothetical protein
MQHGEKYHCPLAFSRYAHQFPKMLLTSFSDGIGKITLIFSANVTDFTSI